MKKLNNKGYMLVEIVLASAIAFGLAYFLLDLIIKVKNKNDDLLVKSLVSTDQAIIANAIMRDLYTSSNIDSFLCSNIKFSGNTFTYTDTNGNDTTVILSEYTDVGTVSCPTDVVGSIHINIKISGKLSDEDFTLDLLYKK